MKGLRDRTAIVTGAARGLGRGIALRLQEEGCRVLAVDMMADGLDTLTGMEVLVQDCTADDAPQQILGACKAAFGGLDILVNNVGLGNAPQVHDTTDDLYDRYLDVNLRAAFRLSRDALPMLVDSRGCIVNIASSIGLSGYMGFGPYTAAKAGLIGLTRQMAATYGPRGLRVNAVAPGVIRTPGTEDRLGTNRFKALVIGTMPLGKAGEPEDIAAAVAFLASDEARLITGQVLAVDGGQTSSVYVSEDMVAAWEASQTG